VVAAQLDELAGRSLRGCLKAGRRQYGRSCRSGEKFTSIHNYLAECGEWMFACFSSPCAPEYGNRRNYP